MNAKRHLSIVASLPCALCGVQPVEVHHLLSGRTPGRRSSDWLTIPLCPDCHRGKNGIHGQKTMLDIMKKTELDLLADTFQKVCAVIEQTGE
jgi:hypothetical protein